MCELRTEGSEGVDFFGFLGFQSEWGKRNVRK